MYELKYIELKSGYKDNGPAWIGKVKRSKSGKTIYFNNKCFQKSNSVYGNYYDIETGDGYWISNVKKDETNRHWAGNGKIFIAKNIIEEYLLLIGSSHLDQQKFIIKEIAEIYPVERMNEIENQRKIQ